LMKNNLLWQGKFLKVVAEFKKIKLKFEKNCMS